MVLEKGLAKWAGAYGNKKGGGSASLEFSKSLDQGLIGGLRYVLKMCNREALKFLKERNFEITPFNRDAATLAIGAYVPIEVLATFLDVNSVPRLRRAFFGTTIREDKSDPEEEVQKMADYIVRNWRD